MISTNATWRRGQSLKSIEREIVLSCLMHNQWNRTRTAEELKVHVRYVRRIIAELRLKGFIIPDSKNDGYGIYRALSTRSPRVVPNNFNQEIGQC